MSKLAFIDTHVAVWLFQGELKKFPSLTKKTLESCELMISPIAALEMEYLFEIKRIKRDSAQVLDYLRDRIGLSLATEFSLGNWISQAKNEKWTRDPFDRLIVANARLWNLPLISADEKIGARYPHTIWK